MLSMRFVVLRLVIINSGKWRENRVWPKNKIYTQINEIIVYIYAYQQRPED